MGVPEFVHLQVRSHYSLLRGASGLEALCAAARARGMTALALTDFDGVYGAVRFWDVARDAGLRPILGAEVTAATAEERDRGDRVTLLVREPAGFASLCRILTRRHLDDRFGLAAVVADHPDGLVALVPSIRLAAALRDALGPDRLRLALGPGSAAVPEGSLDRLRAARRLGIEAVAVNDVHGVDAGDHDLHRLLRAIALRTGRDRVPPSALASPQAWLKPPAAMERAFPHAPEAVAAAVRLAESCALPRPPWGDLVFPRYATLRGASPDAGAAGAVALLRERCLEGARRRYGTVTPRILARLDRELAVIGAKGFADYFLVVQEIVRQSPRTCGRGSAAASIVSYCLGITHVEPIRHDLYFERFLNPGRVDPPDIDVDFCWDERDGVLDWVTAAFGEERVAMIANHVTLRARAAIREVAGVYGLPAAEIARVTGPMARIWGPHPVGTTATHPAFRDPDLDPARGGALARPPWPEILAWAARLDGFPRHLSVHCGGVVIAPDDLARHVAVERAAKGVRVIQWEKDQAEAAGLVKIDLLGNRSLSVVRDAGAAIAGGAGAAGGARLDDDGFDPTDDARTQELLRDGDTMGVFYVESPAMRQLQRKTRRGDFEHLVIHSSIIRPAANEYIREYIRRLRGGAWEPLHPILEATLTETYGIMVYQEDVARVAIGMAGFTDSDADGLRKVLSKKWSGRTIEDYGRRFHEGAGARGVAAEVADAVWRMILSFSGYSFCKPHSASYALVSFRACYLKAHHPAEFMAAVLGNGGGYYATFAYVSECRRMGLRVLPPDVNESAATYTGRSAPRPAGGGTAAAPGDGAAAPAAGDGAAGGMAREAGAAGTVRIGLRQIHGLAEAAIGAIVAERGRGGRFASFDDFLRRAAIDPAAVRLLIRAGACDAIGEDPDARPAEVPAWRAAAIRPRLHWRLAEHEARTAGRRGAATLFPDAPGRQPEPRPYDEDRLLRDEAEALGFLASRHPLTLYRGHLAAWRRAGVTPVRGGDLGRHAGRRVATVGWLVTGKVVDTERGEPMEFVSFEDTTAIYETTFFPRAYARFCRDLAAARPYLLRGTVEEDFGEATLVVDDVAFLDRPPLSRAASAPAGGRAARPAPDPG